MYIAGMNVVVIYVPPWICISELNWPSVLIAEYFVFVGIKYIYLLLWILINI